MKNPLSGKAYYHKDGKSYHTFRGGGGYAKYSLLVYRTGAQTPARVHFLTFRLSRTLENV